MIPRKMLERPEYVYPHDEWRMVERRFHESFIPLSETIFSTANGYLGIRGAFEEGAPAYDNGTYVNGFYESWPIVYPEAAYGLAKTGQSIVNVTDAKLIRLYIDDEPFFLPTATLVSYERALNMKTGTLDRQILWETPSGKRVSIKSQRLVSFRHRHIAAISYEVTLLNADAPVIVSSEMVNRQDQNRGKGDPRGGRLFGHKVLVPRVLDDNGLRVIVGQETSTSHMTIACGVDHVVGTDCAYSYKTHRSDDAVQLGFVVEGEQGKPFRLTKFIAYHTSRSATPEELCLRADRSLDRCVKDGYDALLASQRTFLDEFWYRSDIQVFGDAPVQQAIRFNLFHILQATARAEGAGMPAKGLTGQGYEGHYFWDAEVYVLPFLAFTQPRVAGNLLRFRYSMLEKARQRAREVNQKGALFPWRTINGEEASAYYAAGTAQYHINADIVYALRKYVEVTGDVGFLSDCGAEMLVETARLWRDLGFFSDARDGQFCICGVTGPDEYNTVVDNNVYTNLMARENLWYAAQVVGEIREKDPVRFAMLIDQTQLDPAEIEEWKRAGDRMYIPYDEKLGIHLQDDDFADRKAWDFDNTPNDHYPLLLHYHPLVIYRHKVIKQADVVLAMFLLGDEFSQEQKRRNFDYYDPLTTGDSSLSASIQSIMASEVGVPDKALEYARYAALTDLADIQGNVKDGCHIASIGGTWMVIVYGLAGMRDYGGKLSFHPRMAEKGSALGLRFRLTVREQLLEIDFDRDKKQVTYILLEGTALEISHEGEDLRLKLQEPVQREIKLI